MERLKETIKDEIKDIEKNELSKASIAMSGELVDILKYIKEIEKIEKMDNMTKYKSHMYRVLYIYAVRERREETACGLLSS